jgi:hypothetical protein
VFRNYYVDDLLWSIGGVENTIKILRDLTAMLSTGGWRFTKWLSNCKGVLDEISPHELAPSLKVIKGDHIT